MANVTMDSKSVLATCGAPAAFKINTLTNCIEIHLQADLTTLHIHSCTAVCLNV